MNKQTELERIKKMSHEIIVIADKLLSEYKTPIETLNLSSRAQKCLFRAEIEYVEQLVRLTEKELLRFRNMGKHTVNEIKEKIKRLGYDW